MRTQTTRTIAGRVNPDGTIASPGGGGFTVQRSAAGQYTVTMAPGLRLMAVTAGGGGLASGVNSAFADTVTDRSFRVVTTHFSTGNATDGGFNFTAAVAA